MKPRKITLVPLAIGMAALLWIACATPASATTTSEDYAIEAVSLAFAGGSVESDDYSIVGILTLSPGDAQPQLSPSYWVVPALAGVLQADTPSNLWMFY